MLCQCENLNVFNEKNGTIAHWANDGILPKFPRNKARNAYLEKHSSPRLHLQSTTRLITQVWILYISMEILTAAASHLHNSSEVSVELVFVTPLNKWRPDP